LALSLVPSWCMPGVCLVGSRAGRRANPPGYRQGVSTPSRCP